MSDIVPGCWVDTVRHGPAVCTGIDDKWVEYRYEATRCADDQLIWVGDAAPTACVMYLKPADTLSRTVLLLKGPYGLGELDEEK